MTTQYDCDVMLAGTKLTRKLMAASPMARFVEDEYKPGFAIQSDEELLEFVRGYSQTIFHPVGTCSMGQGADAVVDERLRVYGTAGLRVVDASIMPLLVSGNTNAGTIMIGEKAADMIREDQRLDQLVTAQRQSATNPKDGQPIDAMPA